MGLMCAGLASISGCQDIAIGRFGTGDQFTQEGGHRVADVLCVIDNSGTMSEEQSSLQAGLPAFIETLLKADVDFHLGVITTDVSDPDTAGVLLGSPTVLTRDTPDLVDVFSERALVGIDGSRNELGLEAARLALSEPLLSSSNAGFLRGDAELYILMVSDEDDQSPFELSEYETFLASLKPATAYHVSVIAGDVPFGCASSSGAADPGTRYVQLAQDTDGIIQSICADSFEPGMDRLVQQMSHLQDTFILSKIPDPSSIEVEVDGVLLRDRPTDGWQYLPDLNAVRIYGTPLPLPGQEIYISYSGIHF
jgi:hypothetical protein